MNQVNLQSGQFAQAIRGFYFQKQSPQVFCFMPLGSFYTPRKHRKISGFLTVLGGIERGQWHEMGSVDATSFMKLLP